MLPFGLWAIMRYQNLHGKKDAPEIVIDEVLGMWVALLFVPFSIEGWVVALALFRVFDIFKPWPISLVERKLKGALGVVADDLLAGLAAGVLVRLGTELSLGV